MKAEKLCERCGENEIIEPPEAGWCKECWEDMFERYNREMKEFAAAKAAREKARQEFRDKNPIKVIDNWEAGDGDV